MGPEGGAGPEPGPLGVRPRREWEWGWGAGDSRGSAAGGFVASSGRWGRAGPHPALVRPFPVGLGRGRRDRISGIERRERDRLPRGRAGAARRVERWRGPALAPCSRCFGARRWPGRAAGASRCGVVRRPGLV